MVFGLGDSSYYFFCKAAKQVEARMEELGATKVLPLGIGDDSAEEGMEDGLHDWLDTVWPALELPPPEEVPHITPVKAIFSERAIMRPEDDLRSIQQFYRGEGRNGVSAAILSNELMCSETYNRDFRTIRIERLADLNYELGDALEIWPQNDPQAVEDFLHEYSSDFGDHTVVKLHSFGIDGEISLGALFTHVLDLFGRPSKHFLHQLATFEADEAERNILLDPDFLKTEGKKSGITNAGVLLRFKKTVPPLPALLAMIPVIKPRAYSIASAPLAQGSYIELLVLIETWWCDEGMRYGLNCNMLRQLKSGDHFWCRIAPGSMDPPEPHQPVLCAGIGSGLAPHMAFLRDHVRAAEAGETVGKFSLYFGNRFREEEFLYQAELEGYAAKYDWLNLHVAFSRDDPKKKVYVQDVSLSCIVLNVVYNVGFFLQSQTLLLIPTQLVGITDDARQLLRKDNGLMYVCGNRQLPKPLQEALVKSFSKDSKDADEIKAASEVVEQLYIQGRAQQEVW